MLKTFILVLIFVNLGCTSFEEDLNVACFGKKYENVSLAAYFASEEVEDGETHKDSRGKKLRSLQEFIDDQVDFITLAMDEKLGLPYGTKVCIPELNKHFGHKLKFQVRDNGSDLVGMGYSRADVFVRTEMDSYDNMVNRKVTLVFQK